MVLPRGSSRFARLRVAFHLLLEISFKLLLVPHRHLLKLTGHLLVIIDSSSGPPWLAWVWPFCCFLCEHGTATFDYEYTPPLRSVVPFWSAVEVGQLAFHIGHTRDFKVRRETVCFVTLRGAVRGHTLDLPLESQHLSSCHR